jgi:Zn-finger nucleic acid-binding protein
MHLLAACPQCHRQYEASGHAAGERFRCTCGGVVVVPAPLPHESAVVRCSACGGPRSGEELSCHYCGADFTVHERDLDAVCPECMTRVSSRSRFCHDCGTPLLFTQAAASAATAQSDGPPCPACGGDHRLVSRGLGTEERTAISECPRCGGLWVEREVFEALVERSRQGKIQDFGPEPSALPSPPAAVSAPSSAAPLYRPCVICGALMNRRNYERKSGVIVDICRDHGVWFDLDELSRLLRWIHSGGADRAAVLTAQEERSAARTAHLFPPAWEADETAWLGRRRDSRFADLLSHAFERFLPGIFG